MHSLTAEVSPAVCSPAPARCPALQTEGGAGEGSGAPAPKFEKLDRVLVVEGEWGSAVWVEAVQCGCGAVQFRCGAALLAKGSGHQGCWQHGCVPVVGGG